MAGMDKSSKVGEFCPTTIPFSVEDGQHFSRFKQIPTINKHIPTESLGSCHS
jgi:hypothetical protein